MNGRSFNSQSAATYKAIANLLECLEGLNCPKSDWCFYPSTGNLELTTELYEVLCGMAEFRAFQYIGGSYSLEDGNPYLPELDLAKA